MSPEEQLETWSEIRRTRQAHFTEVLRLENEILRLDLLAAAVARNHVTPSVLNLSRPTGTPSLGSLTLVDCIDAVLPQMPERFKLEDLREAVQKKFPGLQFTVWSFHTTWLRIRRKNPRIAKLGRSYFYQYLERAA